MPEEVNKTGVVMKAIAVILGVGGPAGVAAWKQDFIEEHLLWSLVLLLVYEVLVFLFGFFNDVVDDTKSRLKKPCADWLTAQIFVRFSGYRRRYYRQLHYRHRIFNVRGLKTQGTYKLELNAVFVGLQVAAQNPQKLDSNPLSDRSLPKNTSVWDILTSDRSAFRSVALIGPPGSGKTTLCQHVVIALAKNKQRAFNRRCPALVPVFLFIRDHKDVITSDDPPSLAKLAAAQEKKDNPPPEGWFDSKLRSGQCVVILDGLDEVPDAIQRRKVARWVDGQIEIYGDNRFIITSRPLGYKSNPLKHTSVLEVQSFTREQIEKFVHNWYIANEITSMGGKDDQGVRDEAETGANDLVLRLRSNTRIALLAVNPLLLTMIATVHRFRGALPGRRVELYSEICDVFLGHWRASKGISCTLSPPQLRSVLQPLAFYMMTQEIREISSKNAVEVIEESLKEVGGANLEKPGEFLKQIHGDSGIIVEREVGVFSFAHLTFQEYMASVFMRENSSKEVFLVEQLNESWWHETIRLYVAQGDATNIISACLDDRGPGTNSLALAYECLNEALRVDDRVRQQLERTIFDHLEDEDDQPRRLAAEVLLSIRIRNNFTRLDDNTEMDTTYVSSAEYQAFVDASEAHHMYIPGHWCNKTRFAAGEGLRPILGVNHASAVAYVNWLNQRSSPGGKHSFTYRLPTSAEARQFLIAPLHRDDSFNGLRGEEAIPWANNETLTRTVPVVQLLDRSLTIKKCAEQSPQQYHSDVPRIINQAVARLHNVDDAYHRLDDDEILMLRNVACYGFTRLIDSVLPARQVPSLWTRAVITYRRWATTGRGHETRAAPNDMLKVLDCHRDVGAQSVMTARFWAAVAKFATYSAAYVAPNNEDLGRWLNAAHGVRDHEVEMMRMWNRWTDMATARMSCDGQRNKRDRTIQRYWAHRTRADVSGQLDLALCGIIRSTGISCYNSTLPTDDMVQVMSNVRIDTDATLDGERTIFPPFAMLTLWESRLAGELPAWETIQLVRENTPTHN